MLSDNINSIVLGNAIGAAPIYVDKSGSAFDGLSLIAEAYADDIEALCGSRPEIVSNEPESGVYLMTGLVSDELIKAQGIDWAISPSCGNFKSPDWERYEIKVKKDGERTKVIIAGSDKRGAIYGIFHITEDIFGVSPWIWWADVKPRKRSELTVSVSELETVSKRPSVNFRGFFMNDENPCFNGFADSHFGGLNYMFYDEVFKLILRLRGNYMWPAMWSNNFSIDGMEGVAPGSRFAELEKKYHHKLGGLMYCDQEGHEDAPINEPKTDTATEKPGYLKPGEYPMTLANAVLADRYGVTVGASHHEPMARSGEEWGKLQSYWNNNITYKDPKISSDRGQKVWNYMLNPDNIEKFWSDAIYRNGGLNTMFTVGMRGENDSVLIDDKNHTLTTEENIELLKAVLRTQDRILTNHGVENSPRLLAVYKEVENCWYGGSRDNPAEAVGKGLRDDPDVTGLLGADTNRIVMLCEDNNGYLRTLPELGEGDRFNWGLYYHFDYVGAPKTSMWINTMPLQRTWENLTAAYEYGIDDAWIVNVGDIRPMELPLSYFMNLAYDFETYGSSNPNNCDEYLKTWAREQFAADENIGEREIAGIASLLYDYTWLNGICKPETLHADGEFSYSPLYYGEAQEKLGFAEDIIARADALLAKIPKNSDCYIPFYQMVYYPAAASANVVRIQILFGFNKLYAGRGSTVANTLATLIEKYLKYDEELSEKYCDLGEEFSGTSKWHGIMLGAPDYMKSFHDDILGNVTARSHMNYSSWNTESAVKIIPHTVKPTKESVMIAGLPEIRRGCRYGHFSLPDFESTEKQTYTVTLTNAGVEPVHYEIIPLDDFIVIGGETKGEYDEFTAFTVSIDWSKLGESKTGNISLRSKYNNLEIAVNAKVVDTSGYKLPKLHMPSCGFTVMNSNEFADSGASKNGEVRFAELVGYGKGKSSMKMLPSLSENFEAGEGAWLDYNFAVESNGEYRFTFYVGQNCNLSFDHGNHLNMGVRIDGGEIAVVDTLGEGYIAGSSSEWDDTIQRAGRTAEYVCTLESGEHTLRIYGMEQNLVLQKIVVGEKDKKIEKSLLGPKATATLK
ncbi:MAG: glycosyl hydrolase 115 family protein [Oscillospiraceae bacterium]|nr:glycosyl hydrolase 115 family protein [Oscillospiraceae bacterium]